MRIEQLVRDHIAAIRAAATAAVAHAFAESESGGSKASRPRTPRSRPTRRRSPEEVAELAERLGQAIEAAPGETMSTLSARLGAKPGELAIAVKHLRRQGQIRTVGQRQHTKYFPAVPSSVSAVS
jgi:hypothetical protein